MFFHNITTFSEDMDGFFPTRAPGHKVEMPIEVKQVENHRALTLFNQDLVILLTPKFSKLVKPSDKFAEVHKKLMLTI